MRVLIICAGNTCRSPMAGGLFKRIAKERGIKVDVRTAGVAYNLNARVAENAVAVMKELGIDISGDYSKPVTVETLAWADVVLPIERRHGTRLLEMDPSVARKLRHLEYDVRDPFGGPMSEYRNVRDELYGLLSRVVLDFEPK